MEFFPVLVLLFFAVCVCIAIFTLSSLCGPRNPLPSKLSVYECGVKPDGSARIPFKSSFYLVAVLFLIFDVEGAFFFPWALVYRDSLATSPSLLIAISVYIAFVVLGLLYIFKKGILKTR